MQCRSPRRREFNPWDGKIPPGGGNGNPLQYSGPENPLARGAWWAAVHGGRKESDATEPLSTHNKGGKVEG